MLITTELFISNWINMSYNIYNNELYVMFLTFLQRRRCELTRNETSIAQGALKCTCENIFKISLFSDFFYFQRNKVSFSETLRSYLRNYSIDALFCYVKCKNRLGESLNNLSKITKIWKVKWEDKKRRYFRSSHFPSQL